MSNQIMQLQKTIISMSEELDMAEKSIRDAQVEANNLEEQLKSIRDEQRLAENCIKDAHELLEEMEGQVNFLRNELTDAMVRELAEEIITAIECRPVKDLVVVDAEVVVHSVELTFEWGNLKRNLNWSIEDVIKNYFNYAIKENND